MSEDTYLHLLSEVLGCGEQRSNRTRVLTRSLFGRQLRFDLREGFPLLTTKKVHFKSVVHELLWMVRGDTNVRSLQAEGVTIWDEWMLNESGSLGPVYGAQWRDFNGYLHEGRGRDQLEDVVKSIKKDPFSRRHIVTAWNPSDVDFAALPPCHVLFQFYVSNDKRLSCHMYQRSADIFLGVPFNIASYALLTHMVADVTGLRVGDLVISYGDVHLYENHVEQAREQLTREARFLPTLKLTHRESLFDFKLEDVTLEGYDPHPAIKAEVAV